MRIITALMIVLVPTCAGAQAFGGIGARAEGMAGAFVAVADDATAVYWNPAGLATGATFDLQISRGSAAPGSTLFVGAAIPVLGVSFYRTHTAHTSPDRQNGGSGKVEIRPVALTNTGVTFVQTVARGLVIGTTARIVRGGVPMFEWRTTIDLDAGALMSAGNVRVGVTARNLREPEFDHGSGAVAVGRHVRAGVAFAPRSLPAGVHGPFTVAFDADLTKTPGLPHDMKVAAVGAEYWAIGGLVGLRGGINWNILEADNRAVSGGATVRLPKSVFAEGQLTKPSDGRNQWHITLRVTF